MTASFEVKRASYRNLPPEVDPTELPDNGDGKELALYLLVYRNGELIEIHSDAMEPEDARFSRDLSWVSKLVKKAYEFGYEDGQHDACQELEGDAMWNAMMHGDA